MKKKNYTNQEETPNIVNEPAAVYQSSVPQMPLSNNEDILQQPPCQYTIEELRAGIPKFLRDIESGNVIPHEAIERK